MALVRVQSSPVVISQSTMIVGAILAFFILWLAANGKLATYWNFLIGKGGSSSGSSSSSADPGTGGNTGMLPSWLTPGAPGSIVPDAPKLEPNVPFGNTWWNNFLRPWGLAK